MPEQKTSRFGTYWNRRVNTWRNSIWKRCNKLKAVFGKLGQQVTPRPVVHNEQFKQYALDVIAASQRKASLKSGYIHRAQRRVDSNCLGLRAIAFYLPQYHPIPENDLWWGKGFTEWSNVSRAVPQFLGQYQPRLPGDFGFYDLRLPEVMREQVELAKDYGIRGFCFHHYWFNGRRLLEKPVQDFLKDKTLDIEFCLCWANENWSRRWDGSEHEILMPQAHSPEDDIAFIDDLIPAFQDPRYTRVDGRPVLIVYRATLFPDIAATAQRWRARVKEHGIDDLYLVAALSFNVGNPKLFGFDAGVEFPPHQTHALTITYKQEIINPGYTGQVYDFAELAGRCGKTDPAEFICHKTVMPSWDNTARKLGAGSAFVNDSPAVYAGWLSDAMEVTLRRRPSERLLFINAWNEWGEGAYLEPDRRFGYAYLNATANVLSRTFCDGDVDAFIEKNNTSFAKAHRTAVVLHLYYEELLPDLHSRYFSRLRDVDYFVSVRSDVTLQDLQAVASAVGNVYFVKTENRGRDIYPFLRVLEWLTFYGYEYGCKLHTKKSLHRDDGDAWRDQLMDTLVGADDAVALVERIFDQEPRTGVLVPAKSIHDLAVHDLHVDNVAWLDRLLKLVDGQQYIGNYDFRFSAGSMFWFRIEALRGLLALGLAAADFEYETGQLDGTLAHALERLILLMAAQRSYAGREINLAEYARTQDLAHLYPPSKPPKAGS